MSLSIRFKAVLKAAYQSARDALFHYLFDYIEGPQRCDQVSSIANAFNGCQEQLYESSTTNFEAPETSHPELNKFFLEKRFRKIPAITITRIPGGRAYAGGVVISPDGVIVARDLSMDFGKPFSEHFLCGNRIQRPIYLKGSTLCVTSKGTASYYHWLLDELPRHLVSGNQSFDNIICSRNTAANRLALKVLGLNNVSTFYTDAPTSRLLGRHFSAELLISPSYVAPSGQPSPLLIELLTSFVEPLISKSNSYPHKIFITREKARGRRLINENRIFPMFEAAGYVRIKLEDLAWEEQINLFYHAREIFAPHGAGLANLVFCSNSPLVIEVFNSQYVHWCFWKIAQLVGAQYIPIALPIEGDVDHNPAHYGRAGIQATDSEISVMCRAASL
jgi:hypothetical protein